LSSSFSQLQASAGGAGGACCSATAAVALAVTVVKPANVAVHAPCWTATEACDMFVKESFELRAHCLCDDFGNVCCWQRLEHGKPLFVTLVLALDGIFMGTMQQGCFIVQLPGDVQARVQEMSNAPGCCH
jgi:hypothetical protein